MRKIILIIATIVLLAGCAKLRPYRVDVQQGNIIDQKTISQLSQGMSKNEVRDLLGSPLLDTAFSDNSWTYVYTNQLNGGKVEQKKLIVEFKNNKLERFQTN